MEFNEVKQRILDCPDFGGLDESSCAALLWRSEELSLGEGMVVYSEGTLLDDTFCLLLFGELLVEKSGRSLGHIAPNQIFGEMAYFSPEHLRTATVRVAGPASVLKMHLTRAELSSPHFAPLKKYLGQQAWDRFVSSSQSAAPGLA